MVPKYHSFNNHSYDIVPNYDNKLYFYVDSLQNKPCANGQMEPTNTSIGVWVRSIRITNENKRIQIKTIKDLTM